MQVFRTHSHDISNFTCAQLFRQESSILSHIQFLMPLLTIHHLECLDVPASIYASSLITWQPMKLVSISWISWVLKQACLKKLDLTDVHIFPIHLLPWICRPFNIIAPSTSYTHLRIALKIKLQQCQIKAAKGFVKTCCSENLVSSSSSIAENKQEDWSLVLERNWHFGNQVIMGP